MARMRAPFATLAAGALAASGLFTAPSVAAPLVADLSQHLIKITTNFTGTHVLLFGTIDGPGDVVVTVRGPKQPTVVRRKVRVAGIWVNGPQATFPDAPGFYAVAASRPVDQILTPEARLRHGIGLDALSAKLVPARELEATALAAFRAGLVRNMQARELFHAEAQPVRFLGENLFRVDITFPANVPTGTYNVQVFLIRDHAVVTAQTTPLFVSKAGFGAEVYDFAHAHAAWYGLAAIVLALAAGWLASVVFRRR